MSRKMKDSGIEWIGEIPESWEFCKLGYKSYMIVPMRDKPTSFDGNIPWIRIEDFEGMYIGKSKTEQNVTNELVKEMNLKIYPIGTVLCSCSCDLGKCAIVDKELCSNQTFIGIVPSIMINSKFLYFLMSVSSERLNYLSNGSIQAYLSRQSYEHLKLPFPSRKEQDIISDYLDTRCSLIDQTIKKQKQVIEKLKEYKQSVITEAVTKGLDLNVPMKDSGIEWIGEIPEHWETKIGRYLLKKESREVKENYEVITCFRDGEVTLRKNRREEGFTFADKEIGYQGIIVGDLVIHGMDGFAGAIGISDSEGKGSPVLNVCTSYGELDVNFARYYLRMLASQNVFLALATGIRERSCDLRWNKIASLPFALPKLDEQKNICCYLNKVEFDVALLINKKEQYIFKLESYKKSLIYECVTGKREVK